MATLMQELYWLCEELVSYTDLTGTRFDQDSAQRRLFPMKPIIAKLENKQMEEYYNQLEAQLDNFYFFDKRDFSKVLDAFFAMLGKP